VGRGIAQRVHDAGGVGVTPDWTSPDGSAVLYRADCLEVLPTLAAGSVDAVVTDPPYGIGYVSAWQTRLGGGPRKNRASFGEDVFDASWIPDTFRVLRPDALCFCFSRWDVIGKWKGAFEAAGFKAAQRLVWDKCHWKMGDLRFYGSQVEDVLLCRKGTPEIFPGGKGRRGNIFRYSSAFLPEGQEDHPTQKPVALVAEFVTDGSADGGTILDPFMGSGTTGVACVQTGRKFIGIEISEQYFQIAVKRIQDAQAQLRIPFAPTSESDGSSRKGVEGCQSSLPNL
jgi:DNA modification methylase